MKRYRDEDKSAPRANMTPMIDVTFQLLIFFMCTMRFKTLEGKLSAYLPRDVGEGTDVSKPEERIRIRLDAHEDGVRYTVGPRRYDSLEGARARLTELYALAPERGVTIDAREGSIYVDVVPVLDACALLGFCDISFAAMR